jgi:hypothetical protein
MSKKAKLIAAVVLFLVAAGIGLWTLGRSGGPRTDAALESRAEEISKKLRDMEDPPPPPTLPPPEGRGPRRSE